MINKKPAGAPADADYELKINVPASDPNNLNITNTKIGTKAAINIRSIGDVILDTKSVLINSKQKKKKTEITGDTTTTTIVRVNSGLQIDLAQRYNNVLSDIKSREPASTYSDQVIDAASFYGLTKSAFSNDAGCVNILVYGNLPKGASHDAPTFTALENEISKVSSEAVRLQDDDIFPLLLSDTYLFSRLIPYDNAIIKLYKESSDSTNLSVSKEGVACVANAINNEWPVADLLNVINNGQPGNWASPGDGIGVSNAISTQVVAIHWVDPDTKATLVVPQVVLALLDSDGNKMTHSQDDPNGSYVTGDEVHITFSNFKPKIAPMFFLEYIPPADPVVGNSNFLAPTDTTDGFIAYTINMCVLAIAQVDLIFPLLQAIARTVDLQSGDGQVAGQAIKVYAGTDRDLGQVTLNPQAGVIDLANFFRVKDRVVPDGGDPDTGALSKKAFGQKIQDYHATLFPGLTDVEIFDVLLKKKSLGVLTFPPSKINGNRHFLNSYTDLDSIAQAKFADIGATPVIHGGVFYDGADIDTWELKSGTNRTVTIVNGRVTVNNVTRTVLAKFPDNDNLVFEATTITHKDYEWNGTDPFVVTGFESTVPDPEYVTVNDAQVLAPPIKHADMKKYLKIATTDGNTYVIVENIIESEAESIQGVYKAQIDQYVCSLLNASLITDFTHPKSVVDAYTGTTKEHGPTLGYVPDGVTYNPMHYTENLKLPSLMDILRGYTDENGIIHPPHNVHKLSYAVREISNEFLNRASEIHELDKDIQEESLKNQLTFAELNKWSENGIEFILLHPGGKIKRDDTGAVFTGKIPISCTYGDQVPTTLAQGHVVVENGDIKSAGLTLSDDPPYKPVQHGDGYEGPNFLPTNITLDYNQSVETGPNAQAGVVHTTRPAAFSNRPRIMAKLRQFNQDDDFWTKWLRNDGTFLPGMDSEMAYRTVNIAGTVRHVFEIETQLDNESGRLLKTRYFTVRKASDLGSCIDEMMLQFHKYFASVHSNVNHFEKMIQNGYTTARSGGVQEPDLKVSVGSLDVDADPATSSKYRYSDNTEENTATATDVALARYFLPEPGSTIPGMYLIVDGENEPVEHPSNSDIRIVQLQKVPGVTRDHNTMYDPDNVYSDELSDKSQPEDLYILCGAAIDTQGGKLSLNSDTVVSFEITSSLADLTSEGLDSTQFFDGTFNSYTDEQVPLFYISSIDSSVTGATERGISIRKLAEPGGAQDTTDYTFNISTKQYSDGFTGVGDASVGLQKSLTQLKDVLNRLGTDAEGDQTATITKDADEYIRTKNVHYDDINLQNKIAKEFPAITEMVLFNGETLTTDNYNHVMTKTTEYGNELYKYINGALHNSTGFDNSIQKFQLNLLYSLESDEDGLDEIDNIIKRADLRILENTKTLSQELQAQYDSSGTGTKSEEEHLNDLLQNNADSVKDAMETYLTTYLTNMKALTLKLHDLQNRIEKYNSTRQQYTNVWNVTSNAFVNNVNYGYDIVKNILKLGLVETDRNSIHVLALIREGQQATDVETVVTHHPANIILRDETVDPIIPGDNDDEKTSKLAAAQTQALNKMHTEMDNLDPQVVRPTGNNGNTPNGNGTWIVLRYNDTNAEGYDVIANYSSKGSTAPDSHEDVVLAHAKQALTSFNGVVEDGVTKWDIRPFKNPVDMHPAYPQDGYSHKTDAVGDPDDIVFGAAGDHPTKGTNIYLPIIDYQPNSRTTCFYKETADNDADSNDFNFNLYSWDDRTTTGTPALPVPVTRLSSSDTNEVEPTLANFFNNLVNELTVGQTNYYYLNLLTNNATFSSNKYHLPDENFALTYDLPDPPVKDAYTFDSSSDLYDNGVLIRPQRLVNNPVNIDVDITDNSTSSTLVNGVGLSNTENKLVTYFASANFSVHAGNTLEPDNMPGDTVGSGIVTTLNKNLTFDFIYVTLRATGTTDSTNGAVAHFTNLHKLVQHTDNGSTVNGAISGNYTTNSGTNVEDTEVFYLDSSRQFVKVTGDDLGNVTSGLILLKIKSSTTTSPDDLRIKGNADVQYSINTSINNILNNANHLDINMHFHQDRSTAFTNVSQEHSYMYSIYRKRYYLTDLASDIQTDVNSTSNGSHRYLSHDAYPTD